MASEPKHAQREAAFRHFMDGGELGAEQRAVLLEWADEEAKSGTVLGIHAAKDLREICANGERPTSGHPKHVLGLALGKAVWRALHVVGRLEARMLGRLRR